MNKRNEGLDLLRCLSMLMIAVVHLFGHGGVLGALTPGSTGYNLSALVYTLVFCAVNCYALISGYVGVTARHRCRSLAYHWLVVVFWGVVLALIVPLIRLDAAQPLNIHLEPGEVIEAGQTHPNIYIVQGILLVFSEAYGAPKVSATGVLDAETSLALREFQRVNGLPQTGQLDKLTWRLLALQYPLAADTLLGSQQS